MTMSIYLTRLPFWTRGPHLLARVIGRDGAQGRGDKRGKVIVVG